MCADTSGVEHRIADRIRAIVQLDCNNLISSFWWFMQTFQALSNIFEQTRKKRRWWWLSVLLCTHRNRYRIAEIIGNSHWPLCTHTSHTSHTESAKLNHILSLIWLGWSSVTSAITFTIGHTNMNHVKRTKFRGEFRRISENLLENFERSLESKFRREKTFGGLHGKAERKSET